MRKTIGTLSVLAITFNFAALAQRNRITAPVDSNRRAALNGHVHPRALPENDQGPVDASMTLPYVTLILKPSPAQQSALEQFLAGQQDPSSPDYHKWLTPEQYADRFGVSQDDLDKLVAWLKSQGLNVISVARARNAVAFSGSAGQVQKAFNTGIHHYLVNGKTHFANADEPSIPAAFGAVIGAIHGLNDFHLKPAVRTTRAVTPDYTSSRGTHYLAPDDVATIYNLKSLYAAGINGSGQKIVVAGQTRVDLSDIQQFRTYFNLPANDPQPLLVPGSTDPGTNSSDMSEADLDLELAGAAARNATILYVYAYDVMNAVQYAIDQNLAPVVSISYGSCEANTLRADALTMQSWAQQANAQGITWFAASGDAGGADCYGDPTGAGSVLSVDLPAGIPEVTGVGGTEFTEGTGNYWNSTNDGNQASAVSYIPETAWNDSAIDGQPSASGGGASTMFPKPSWQTGAGIPSDGARDVPDVSIAGSADHDGFLIYSGGSQQIVGGTSVGSPTFAGIAAMLNQYLVGSGMQSSPGLGNINPRLYALAQSSPGIFHDITTGNNLVSPCSARSRFCSLSPIGYNAGVGYDQATGLGSVDAYSLVTAWHQSGAVSPGGVFMTLSSSAASITPDANVTLTATVRSANGGTPTGTVTFYFGNASLGSAALAGSGDTATAALTVPASQLSNGSDTIAAQYAGDSVYVSAAASVTVTVASATTGAPAITGLTNGASYAKAYAPGMVLAIFGSQLAPDSAGAPSVPLPQQLLGVSVLINGIAAPLYYASPGQLNVQIPYEIVPGSTAVLSVNNNGQTAFTSFPVTQVAPGIFADQNGSPVPDVTGARGQIITLYITGDGALSPPLATGAAPLAGTDVASLPKPVQNVAVTVGGMPASVKFVGIPWGLVGVTQINYQVPADAPLGPQQVVVTVGGIGSAPANLMVTQ